MAPLLSRTLTLIRPTSSPIFTSSRLLPRRRHLSTAATPQFIEINLDSTSSDGGSGVEKSTARMLEDFVQGIIVRRSTPDWIPFVPGASFWVPPGPRVPQIVGRMRGGGSPSMLEEEMRSVTCGVGVWPCESFFLHDVMPQHSAAMEVEVEVCSEPDSDESSQEQASQGQVPQSED